MPFKYEVESISDREMAVLRVTGELDFDDRGDFRVAIDELLETPQPKRVVDLSQIKRMSSVYIGTLIDAGSRSRATNSVLSVILCGRMARVCREAGLERVVRIVDVE